MQSINYGRHFLDSKDLKYVNKVLKNEMITRGPLISKFENYLSKFTSSKFTTVCNNGTSAIMLAFLGLNIKKDDVVIMPSINFIAAYNVASTIGAKVYLSDVDKFTGQMTPKYLEECIKKFKIKKVKAILVQYHGGYPENVEKFYILKKKLKCLLIEDACHAFGAKYLINNKKFMVGSCKHSDICTFSFHPLKTITTGEGGAITTNSRKIDSKIKQLRSNGIIKNKKIWLNDSNFIGQNFNLTDFQCAMGISQLKKINKFLKNRKIIFDRYSSQLKNLKKIKIVKYSKNIIPSYHLYLIHLSTSSIKKKEKFFKYMKKNKINLMYHYIPLYKYKSFKGKFIKTESEKYYLSCFSLPIYYSLKNKQQKYIISKIKEY
jgi:dTDP-4-amino-4,6-dideoxygalactose transaminase